TATAKCSGTPTDVPPNFMTIMGGGLCTPMGFEAKLGTTVVGTVSRLEFPMDAPVPCRVRYRARGRSRSRLAALPTGKASGPATVTVAGPACMHGCGLLVRACRLVRRHRPEPDLDAPVLLASRRRVVRLARTAVRERDRGEARRGDAAFLEQSHDARRARTAQLPVRRVARRKGGADLLVVRVAGDHDLERGRLQLVAHLEQQLAPGLVELGRTRLEQDVLR